MSVPADLERFVSRKPITDPPSERKGVGPDLARCAPQTGFGSRLASDHEAALIELGRVTRERDKALRELARARNLTPDHPEYQRIWALGWVACDEGEPEVKGCTSTYNGYPCEFREHHLGRCHNAAVPAGWIRSRP